MSWFGTGVSWFDSGGSCCRAGDLNSVFKIKVVQFYNMHRNGIYLLGFVMLAACVGMIKLLVLSYNAQFLSYYELGRKLDCKSNQGKA